MHLAVMCKHLTVQLASHVGELEEMLTLPFYFYPAAVCRLLTDRFVSRSSELDEVMTNDHLWRRRVVGISVVTADHRRRVN